MKIEIEYIWEKGFQAEVEMPDGVKITYLAKEKDDMFHCLTDVLNRQLGFLESPKPFKDYLNES